MRRVLLVIVFAVLVLTTGNGAYGGNIRQEADLVQRLPTATPIVSAASPAASPHAPARTDRTTPVLSSTPASEG